MERFVRIVVRWRWVVLLIWVAVTVVSILALANLKNLLSNEINLPGTDSQRVEQILRSHFDQNPSGSFTVVVQGRPGSARTLLPKVKSAADAAVKTLPTGRVGTVQPVSNSVVYGTLISNLTQADAKQYTPKIRAALGKIPGAQVYVSGQAAVDYDLEPVFAHDLQVGELFIALPIALLVLIFVFGTLAFLIPLLFAAAAIPPALGVVWILAHFIELSSYLQNLIMLIGLGIAIDYSLLIVYRYREEIQRTKNKEDAIVATMNTAGRTVIFSGTIVAVGLALLIAMPLPFLRGFGIGGLLIPIVSIICTLTLLPGILYLVGGKLDSVRLLSRKMIKRREGEGSSVWMKLSRVIMRRPVAVAVSTTVLLLLATVPLLYIELGPGGSFQGIPQNIESVQAVNILSKSIGAGAVTPTSVVVDTGKSGGASAANVRASVSKLERGLVSDPQVSRVGFNPKSRSYVDSSGRYLQISVIGKSEYGSLAAQDFVARLREKIIPAAAFPKFAKVYAGGGPPTAVDFINLAYNLFPWLILAVLVITYFLLVRVFRSLILPLKAIIMNMLTIGASFGLIVLCFKWGAGSVVGISSLAQVEAWIPVFIFAMMFGLSMDYEVFLVHRMREEWDKGRTNEEAVSYGLAKTGRIVTAAGLIMFFAFTGFLAGSVVGLQEFGFGLAAAIIIDVSIVRALLVPSTMKLFGQWNWWLPPKVAHIFRVAPSPI